MTDYAANDFAEIAAQLKKLREEEAERAKDPSVSDPQSDAVYGDYSSAGGLYGGLLVGLPR